MPLSSPQPSQPIPPEFFPPDDPLGSHGGIRRELAKQRYILPSIKTEADYRAAYAAGFSYARDYLLRLPAEPPLLTPRQMQLVHQYLYTPLYRDSGLWATEVASFNGRVGADPEAIEPELALLHEQCQKIAASWQATAGSEEWIIDRLALIVFFHARFLLVHPFRDGNGRVARMIGQWHEWRFFGVIPSTLVPRAVYISALDALPAKLESLLNFFSYRKTGWNHYSDVFPSPFPLRVTIRP